MKSSSSWFVSPPFRPKTQHQSHQSNRAALIGCPWRHPTKMNQWKGRNEGTLPFSSFFLPLVSPADIPRCFPGFIYFAHFFVEKTKKTKQDGSVPASHSSDKKNRNKNKSRTVYCSLWLICIRGGRRIFKSVSLSRPTKQNGGTVGQKKQKRNTQKAKKKNKQTEWATFFFSFFTSIVKNRSLRRVDRSAAPLCVGLCWLFFYPNSVTT